MPGMMEIYQKHSAEYDELVGCEDYEGNLPGFLNTELDFDGKTVVEFGCGTGRVTALIAERSSRLYCYDRSAHMLEAASENLSRWADKIDFGICDNSDIARLDVMADIVIQGWSFGHLVSDAACSPLPVIDKLVEDCRKLLNPGGHLVLIETLGTNTEEPGPVNENHRLYFRRLEDEYGFVRNVLRTDYRFESAAEARRIMGFFFGDEMGRALDFEEGCKVREYTGVWIMKNDAGLP